VTEVVGTEILRAVERFLASSQYPVLCEPGEEWLAITPDNFVLEVRGACVQLQAWDQRRNLVRRVTAVERETRGKLALKVARFGKPQGTLELMDRGRALRDNVPQKTARLGFREQFRQFLRRQFPSYKLADLTTEADLEHTLSPAYPRAFLRQGAAAWAAIGAPLDASRPDGVLTFGLIWLDYLRQREPSLALQGLVLYLPSAHAKTTCLRLLFLDPAAAEYRAFAYDDQGLEERIDLLDYGNLDTHLEPRHGRELPRPVRSDGHNPEAWLESVVRGQIQEIDAALLPAPVYGQVPAFAARDRGVMDLLAVDHRGRLAVIELKASEDVHLPLQAMDYWMRVQWHVERNEFQAKGYFPGRELIREAPRLLLVSPALDLHPSNERVLRYFSPRIPVEQIGVGLEWRKELKVMYRSGTPCPIQTGSHTCQSKFSTT
jgi:hypothetical protein